MKKRTWKKTLCYLLIAALLAPSLPVDTTKSQAAAGRTTINDGEYTTGIFAGKYGIDQLFDYIMSTSRLNSLPYDASWGVANASTGHQLSSLMMKGKHFILKYSGDDTYPIALCLYNDDDTPFVSGRDGSLNPSSRVGKATNICLQNSTAAAYMEEHYTDGIEGVMALCKMGKADKNGLYFESKNGFGYYLSGNQGRDVGEYIFWKNADTNVTMEDLAAMTGYSSNSLQAGEYAVTYLSEGGAKLMNMPKEQTKKKGEDLTLSDKTPIRKGYRFVEWNTESDGSGTSYEPGDVYSADEVVTLYAVWNRYYESGLFGSKLSNAQLFDNVTSANMINGNIYDASWGTANASSGHQFSDEQLKGRFFVFRYSGDDTYPVALFMFEEDGTPVTKESSDNLFDESLIGDAENVCCTNAGQEYMEETYEDGIHGLVAQGYISQYDENGVTFRSKNGFGYYASINRGYKKGDHIEWNDVVTNPTVEELDSIDTFADAEMFDGEYAIIYNENTDDVVTEFPQTQKKEDMYSFIITTQVPERDGYEFVGWNTKKDGTGETYEAGSRYTGKGVLPLYAIWKEETKASLEIYENGKKISKTLTLSNETEVEKIVKNSSKAEDFYTKLNDISLSHIYEIKGGYGEDDVYKAVCADTDVAECQVDGSTLILTGKKDGFTYVTVTDETSGQIYRLSVTVKTLKDKLFILRPNTNAEYKDYLTTGNKVGYNVSSNPGKEVTWKTDSDKAESIRQLSNGDCIVWKPTAADITVDAVCGVNTTAVSIKDMLSGESAGAYPINTCTVSSAYKQIITLSDSTGKGKESDFTVKAFLVDDKGNVLSKADSSFKKDVAHGAYSFDVSFDDVDKLDNASVVLEVTTEGNTYEPKLVQYPVYQDGQQVNSGMQVQLNSEAAVTDQNTTVDITDEEGKALSSLVIDKNETKSLVVKSSAASKHTVTIKVSGKEYKPAKEEEIYYDGMKNQWKKSTFTVSSKDTTLGRYPVDVVVKDSSKGDILSNQTTSFTIANITDIPSPEKPDSINFVGDFDTPKLSAGKVIDRSLKFNLPKVLPMKVSFQDTDDPFKKTFMIAIGNAGLDEDNVVAAVTETINDIKDNKLTKTLSGYAFGNADFVDGKWVMTYTGGGIAGSIQYEFGFNNNVVVGFVPLYYGVKVGATASIDALISGKNVYHDKFVGLDLSTNSLKLTSEYDFVTDILVGVKGYVGASGGVGFDGKVVKLKFGAEGNLSLEYNHRVIAFNDLNKTKTYNGGYLNFSGDIGLYFEFKLLLIKYKKKIVGTGFSTGKDFGDWKKFPLGRPNLLDLAGMESAEVSMLAMESKDDEAWYDYIDPYIPPVLSNDGKTMGMVYTDNLEDLGTINPAVSTYDGKKWLEPTIYSDWRTDGKTQTVNAIDYDSDGDLNVLAFDAMSYDKSMADKDTNDIGSEEFNDAANTDEIHVYVNGEHTQLTDNAAADMTPVVSVNNGKAIVVWQSDTYDLQTISETSVQEDAQGEKKLYFSYYDGTTWSTPQCLENGEIKGVQSYDVTLSDDGKAMVLASMGSGDRLQERELFSYLIEEGTVKSINRVTCNDCGETQPRVKYVTDQDGMFLAAWQQSEYEGDAVSKKYVALQGFNMDGSANDVSAMDSGDIAENFDFAKGGDNISSSALCWNDIGEDSQNHTYAKYITKEDDKEPSLSMKYEINSVSASDEAVVGNTVAKTGDSFTVVSCSQPQPQSTETTEGADQPEKPAKLAFAQKTIKDSIKDASADAFDQNIVPSSNINVTVSFTNAARKKINTVSIKNNGTTVVENYPVSLESGESGHVKFTYALSDTLKNEEFTIEADNGTTAKATLVLLAADIVVSNPELTGTVSGGERMLQVVVSNAGTLPLDEDSKVTVDFSMADEKNIEVNPLSDGAAWDDKAGNVVISGKDAMEAINKGEYILQFGYKPTFTEDADTIALSLTAAAYSKTVELDELNPVDNTTSFSMIKPSKLYEEQLVYDTIIENGTITGIKVTNQYETAIEKCITISNGTSGKKINVSLKGEESKIYAVGLSASDSLEYTTGTYDGEESPEYTPTPSPSESPDPAASASPQPAGTPAPEESATPAPNPAESPNPSGSPNPSETTAPTGTPAPIMTAVPSTTPNPTGTSKPTKTPRPTRTPRSTKTPRPTKTPKPTKTPTPVKTAAPTQLPTQITTPEPASPQTVKLGKALIRKLKNAAKKKVTVTIKPVAGATGYKVIYSTNKKFKKAKSRTTYIPRITLKRMKKGKTYYIKVMAFTRDANGRKVYGKAGKAKKIKIKK